jgi:hypothetical protein
MALAHMTRLRRASSHTSSRRCHAGTGKLPAALPGNTWDGPRKHALFARNIIAHLVPIASRWSGKVGGRASLANDVFRLGANRPRKSYFEQTLRKIGDCVLDVPRTPRNPALDPDATLNLVTGDRGLAVLLAPVENAFQQCPQAPLDL